MAESGAWLVSTKRRTERKWGARIEVRLAFSGFWRRLFLAVAPHFRLVRVGAMFQTHHLFMLWKQSKASLLFRFRHSLLPSRPVLYSTGSSSQKLFTIEPSFVRLLRRKLRAHFSPSNKGATILQLAKSFESTALHVLQSLTIT